MGSLGLERTGRSGNQKYILIRQRGISSKKLLPHCIFMVIQKETKWCAESCPLKRKNRLFKSTLSLKQIVEGCMEAMGDGHTPAARLPQKHVHSADTVGSALTLHVPVLHDDRGGRQDVS